METGYSITGFLKKTLLGAKINAGIRNFTNSTMSARPETTTKETHGIEAEYASPEHDWGAEVEPTSQSTAEPVPEWDMAVETWGAAWDIHQYGLGGLFGIVGVLALVAILRICKSSGGVRQKKVSVVVLSQIVLFGLSRCLFLCVDAYHSKGHVPSTVVHVIWGIGEPCLITAFMLIFLVLRNALVMKSRFQNWYTTRNIALVTVPYYTFVFASEMIVSFIPAYRALILACQISNILLYLILASFYSYISILIWKTLRLVRRAASKGQEGGKQTSAIFKRCIAAAVIGFSAAALLVYAAVGMNGVFSNELYVSPWPWFTFTTSLRCLEIGMSVLLYTTSVYSAAGQQNRRRIDVAPMTVMQSK